MQDVEGAKQGEIDLEAGNHGWCDEDVGNDANDAGDLGRG